MPDSEGLSEIQRISPTLGEQWFPSGERESSIRYYGKSNHDRLIRVDYHGAKEIPTGTGNAILKAAGIKKG